MTTATPLTSPAAAAAPAPLTNAVATSARAMSAPAASALGKPELTAEQKTALKHLHATAQQFESLFVNMLFKSMRAASPQTSITGDKQSPAETTFTEMLDQQRSEAIAQTGAFGITKILDDQLRAAVLANPAQAAKTRVPSGGGL